MVNSYQDFERNVILYLKNDNERSSKYVSIIKFDELT